MLAYAHIIQALFFLACGNLLDVPCSAFFPLPDSSVVTEARTEEVTVHVIKKGDVYRNARRDVT